MARKEVVVQIRELNRKLGKSLEFVDIKVGISGPDDSIVLTLTHKDEDERVFWEPRDRCEVIQITDDFVELRSLDKEKTFKLSKEEFELGCYKINF